MLVTLASRLFDRLTAGSSDNRQFEAWSTGRDAEGMDVDAEHMQAGARGRVQSDVGSFHVDRVHFVTVTCLPYLVFLRSGHGHRWL